MEENNIGGARLRVAAVKRDKLWKAYEQAHAQASSVLNFTLQWKDLEEHLDSTRSSIEKGLEEMASREKRVEEARREVEQREGWVALEEKLLKDSKDRVSKCEEQLFECSKELKSKNEQLGMKEKQLGLVDKSLEKYSREVELKRKKLSTLEKTIQERSRDIDLREAQLSRVQNQLEQHSKEVKSKEDQLARFSREYKFQEDQLAQVERMFEVRSTELSLKEGELEKVQELLVQAATNISLKEEKLGEIQKLLTDRSAELSLKDEELVKLQKLYEERSEEIASQTKQLGELAQELTSRNSALGAVLTLTAKKSTELQSIEKRIYLLNSSVQETLQAKNKPYDEIQISIEECSRKSASTNKMKRESFEEPHAESESKENKLDSVVELLNSLSKELEEKKKELVSVEGMLKKYGGDVEIREREFKEIQKSIEEHNELLKSKVKQLQSIQTSIENQDRELRQKKEELELTGKDLSSVQKSIRVLFDELALKENNFNSMRRLIEEDSVNLQRKEKKFEEIEKEKEKQLELSQKSVEERIREVELKEQRLIAINTSPSKNLQCRDFLLNNTMQGSYTSRESFASIDGKTLQSFINEHLSRHDLVSTAVSAAFGGSSDPAMLVLDAMQGFYPNSGEGGSLQFDSVIIKRSCIILLEQLMRFSPQIKPQVREEARMVANQWKARMIVESNSLDVLAFLQLLAIYGLASMFNPDELRKLTDMVAEHSRQVSELRHAFGFNEMEIGRSSPSAKIKIEGGENVVAQDALIPFSKYTQTNPLISVLSFLEDHSDVHDSTANEISNALKTALDPAVVLDAIKKSCHQEWENGLRNLKRVFMVRCILVLEHLERASTPITSYVKEGAQKLAIKWKANIRSGSYCLKVFVFLHLLVAYGLLSSFERDEILELFLAVAHRNKALDLGRALGLSDMMNDVIESLINKKQYLEAIEYIYAFQLCGKFSPIILLQKFLQNVTKSINKIRRRGKQDLAIEKETAAYRAAGKCMSDYKLENKVLSNLISKRLMELQGKMEDERTIETMPPARTIATNDHVQEQSVTIAASSAAKVHLQQLGMQSMTPSPEDHSQQKSSMQSMTPSPEDHSQQKSSNTAAMPSTGNELQKKVGKLRREGPSIFPSKCGQSSDNINSTAYNNGPKRQTIINAATTVMEAKLQHKDENKESTRNSTSLNQSEQQRNYVVGPSSLAMEGTAISASEDHSQHPSVSKPATPGVQVKHEPSTMKRDFKSTFSSKKYAKWERNNKRRKPYTPIPHTSGTAPGTGMHLNSSAWRPHRPIGIFNEGVSNFDLPPPPTHFGVEGGWPNGHHSGTQFFAPYMLNRH